MSRRRFFVDRIVAGLAELEGEDATHLSRVLRAVPGQLYELSDNHALYLAEISSVEKRRVAFRILEPLPHAEPRARLTLLAALVKFDRFEWIVEKATELGVAAVVPVIAQRSEKGLDGAAAKRIERWRKIARQASQQSRRVRIPEIREALPLKAAASEATGLKVYLEEAPGAPRLARLLRDRDPAPEVWLAVGPEGGWTDPERDRLAAAGFAPASLGQTILRAETAALAALAIASHLMETPAIE